MKMKLYILLIISIFIMGCSSEEPKQPTQSQSVKTNQDTNQPVLKPIDKEPAELKISDIVISNSNMTRSSTSTKVMAEAYNKSKIDCDGGVAKAIFYDDNGKIVQTAPVMIPEIPPGGKAVITGNCQVGKNINVAKYEIQINSVTQR